MRELSVEEQDERARAWEREVRNLRTFESSGYWRGFSTGMVLTQLVGLSMLAFWKYLHG